MTKIHHNVLKAQQRAIRAKTEYELNVLRLELAGFFVVLGRATRKNKYQVYIYPLDAFEMHPALKNRNNPKHAVAVYEIWGKYKDVAFLTDTQITEQINDKIDSFLYYHYK